MGCSLGTQALVGTLFASPSTLLTSAWQTRFLYFASDLLVSGGDVQHLRLSLVPTKADQASASPLYHFCSPSKANWLGAYSLAKPGWASTLPLHGSCDPPPKPADTRRSQWGHPLSGSLWWQGVLYFWVPGV